MKFPLEKNLALVQASEQECVRQIEEAFKNNDGDIAAIILETIQGEGGDNHFRPEFHKELRRLADTHEAMLIYDEVQCGMGLTGKMWAYQHYGITPDIIAFGKKAQVCGIMAGPRVDQAKDNVFVEKSRINSTWGGNIVDMVRCKRFLEIMEEDGLVENAKIIGELLQNELAGLEGRHPALVSNVRGKGLMCSFDLPTTEQRNRLIAKALEIGAILLPCGELSMRLRPSLTFTAENVSELIRILDQALLAL